MDGSNVWGDWRESYLFEPSESLVGEVVSFAVVFHVLHELREDRLEGFE